MREKKRRPRLTRKAIDGLNALYSLAGAAVDELVGRGDWPEDHEAYDGLEYLEDLIAWYLAKPRKKRPP